MKKQVLLMIVMLMSLNVGAQEMEVFDGSYGYMVTNVVNGEKERCCYITKVEPYSQIDLAGISVGTLIVPSDTVNNVCLLYTSPSPRD